MHAIPTSHSTIDIEVSIAGSFGIGTFMIFQRLPFVKKARNMKKKPIYPPNERYL